MLAPPKHPEQSTEINPQQSQVELCHLGRHFDHCRFGQTH